MSPIPLIAVSLCAVIRTAAAADPAADTMIFPEAAWVEATPESQQMDSAKLQDAVAFLEANSGKDGARELVIIRNGRLIWKGDNIDHVHGIWSCTKSFTSTVLGLLIADGKCSLDTRAATILPELQTHYGDVTLRHFTTMTSGYRADGDETNGGYTHGPSATPFKPNAAPLFAPGTAYAYWDSAMNELGLALTRLAGEPLDAFFKRRIADPIGMNAGAWKWGHFGEMDGLRINGGSGNHGRHVQISAREMARLGHLFLNEGQWNGRQLIPADWVRAATAVQVPETVKNVWPRSRIAGPGHYGFNWWRNGAGGKLMWPGAPAGAFAALGHNNNKLIVIPEWQMGIVRLGLDEGDKKITDETVGGFLERIGNARLTPAPAAEHRVTSAAEIARLAESLQPGDVLVMADGSWTDQRIVFRAKGTAEKPVTLRAETAGKVVLGGESSLVIDGEHVVVSGLHIKDSTAKGDGVKLAGEHCRLTETAVTGGACKFFVHVFGKENRVDHCYLADKTSDSPTLQIEVEGQPNRHRIDHNHFGPRPPLGRNGGETIRVGYSHQSMSSSATVVEQNLFDRCDGELEIISNKSCDNIYRGNTFLDCAGMFTLRHGNRCLVEGNFFLGHHKRGSGGIRVIGDDHTVINNYIDGVMEGAFRITSGIPDSPLKGYFQARRCVVAFNTVVDSRGPSIEVDAGIGTSGRTLRPEDITIANNLFALPKEGVLLKGTESATFKWTANILTTDSPPVDHAGLKIADAKLTKPANGLWRPDSGSAVRGAAEGSFPAVKTDIDGQPRAGSADIGCDQLADAPVTNYPLTASDAGPSWMDRQTAGKNAASPGVAKPPGTVALPGLQAASSEWVHKAPDGKLVYKTTMAGDRIMDFSHAGYMGGGVGIPNVPVKRTVQPSGGEDDAAIIQKAIDEVAAMKPENGFRGAVLLGPGVFSCPNTITISASGVVLRGSGSAGAKRTTIKLTGKPHGAIRMGGGRERRAQSPDATNAPTPAATTISDVYVPSGAMTFNVADASGFAAGDWIEVRRPVTEVWIKFMQMHDLVRDGRPQAWIRAGNTTNTERRIASLSGKSITLDIPLADSFDSKYLNPPGTVVVKIKPPERLSQAGIEHLHIESPPQEISHTQPHFTAMRMNGQDCWVRDVVCNETMNSIGINGRRITLRQVAVHRKARHEGSSKPAEFAPNAGQLLLDRCSGSGDNVWYAATGGGNAGPVVMLNCTFEGNGRIESHQRWSTGMLYDNCKVPGGGIDFRNRGSMGSGHGWTMGWGVAWNCQAKDFVIQNPPGAANWMIGCTGESKPMPRPFGTEPNLPEGVRDSHGMPVTPQSLYLAQLAERLGPQALKNIGY